MLLDVLVDSSAAEIQCRNMEAESGAKKPGYQPPMINSRKPGRSENNGTAERWHKVAMTAPRLRVMAAEGLKE